VTVVNLFHVCGGLGLFLFSMRLLTAALHRSVARRLKAVLESAMATPTRAMFVGLWSTALVQASSITIIMAMGLVASSIITLEQGYYAMLGAAIGTTIKGWVLAFNVDKYGGFIIGLSSLGLVIVRRPILREILEIILAIGFTFFGLDLLANGLEPISHLPEFKWWMEHYNGSTLSLQFLGMITGCVLTIAVESSSTILLLTIHLATLGTVTLAGGASLILGANIGTTLLPWLTSLEYDANVRRLAWAHILVKVLGVVITLFFFPLFLLTVDLSMRLIGVTGIGAQLAAVQSLFNILSAVTFGLLGGLMIKLLTRLVPETVIHSTAALPLVVRRMLTRTPERALEEADRQMKLIDNQTKTLTDSCFLLLMGGHRALLKRAEEARFRRDFEALRDAVHDLLLRLSRRRLTPDQRQQMHSSLQLLARFQDVQAQGLSLLTKLSFGLGDPGQELPVSMQTALSAYQTRFDSLWLRIHYRHRPNEEETAALICAADELDVIFFSAVLEDQTLTPEQTSWIYEVVTRLRLLADMAVSLGAVMPVPQQLEQVNSD